MATHTCNSHLQRIQGPLWPLKTAHPPTQSVTDSLETEAWHLKGSTLLSPAISFVVVFHNLETDLISTSVFNLFS